MENSMTKLQVNSDGIYRWYYEVGLFRNPTVLITLYKVFGGIVIGCALGLGLIIGVSSGDLDSALGVMKGFGIAGIVIFVLVTISYLIYAAIQGGKYCVVFEMDKASVTHTQIAKQFKKAQIMGALAALAGAANGSLTLIGTGILAGSRSSMQTTFEKVRKIKVKRHRNVIYLLSYDGWNQIYAERDSFDEVLDFILAQIPETASGREALIKHYAKQI